LIEAGRNYFQLILVVCVTGTPNVRMFVSTMRRFNFFVEQEWLDRAKRDMGSHGFRNVASFFRFIIINFFNKDKGNTEK
jgi:hypothetical protein